MVKFEKHDVDACIPKKATSQSAGYDLYSAVEQEIPPGGNIIIDSKIGVHLPEHHAAMIKSRSGLAFNYSVFSFEGLIDRDYNSSIKILMFNKGKHPFVVKKSMRIAQLVVFPIFSDSKQDVFSAHSGFGSTGYF
jgi:dUTP pyrophosphatase